MAGCASVADGCEYFACCVGWLLDGGREFVFVVIESCKYFKFVVCVKVGGGHHISRGTCNVVYFIIY